MVNRGGRSKGCKTCRTRKVKCDEKRPSCERCLKAGVDCDGYIQFAEFVAPVGNRCAPNRVQRHSQTVTISQHQPKVPDEGTTYITYLVERLLSPRNHVEQGSMQQGSLLPLPSFKQSSTPTSTTHRSAVEALAAAYFGRMHRDQRAMSRAAQLYVETLGMLHSDLSDERRSLLYETLASVLFLGMYENIILSSNSAWLAHFDGISRIVKARGPGVLKDEREMVLFRRCRFAVIVSALMHRRHCFLASPDWKDAIAIESAGDHIHEIFAEVPGILHDFGKLPTPNSTTYNFGMRARVESLVCSLHRWESGWVPANEPYNSDAAHNDGDSINSTLDASLLALQKAILLCLGSICTSLRISLKLGKTWEHYEEEATAEEGRLNLAMQICDLAETCLRESTDSSHKPFLFVFPLQVASRNLQPGSEDAVRAVLLMEYLIADTHGFELGRQQIRTDHLLSR